MGKAGHSDVPSRRSIVANGILTLCLRDSLYMFHVSLQVTTSTIASAAMTHTRVLIATETSHDVVGM